MVIVESEIIETVPAVVSASSEPAVGIELMLEKEFSRAAYSADKCIAKGHWNRWRGGNDSYLENHFLVGVQGTCVGGHDGRSRKEGRTTWRRSR